MQKSRTVKISNDQLFPEEFPEYKKNPKPIKTFKNIKNNNKYKITPTSTQTKVKNQ